MQLVCYRKAKNGIEILNAGTPSPSYLTKDRRENLRSRPKNALFTARLTEGSEHLAPDSAVQRTTRIADVHPTA